MPMMPPPIPHQNSIPPLSSHGASPLDAATTHLNRPVVKMKRTGGRPEGSPQSWAPPTTPPPVGLKPSPSTAPLTLIDIDSDSSSSSDDLPAFPSINSKTGPDSDMRDAGHEEWPEGDDGSLSDSSMEDAPWQSEEDKSSAAQQSHGGAPPAVPSGFSSTASGRRYDTIGMSAQHARIPLGCC